MSETNELQKDGWADYLDSVTKASAGKLVTMELMSGELGDQVDVERLPLNVIGYDHKDDVLEVGVGGFGTRYPVVLRHLISAPTSVAVEESAPGSPTAMRITDSEGVVTLVKLFEPAELEAG